MSWASIFLTGLFILATSGLGWWLHSMSQQRSDTELAWFRLLPVGASLWGESASAEIDRARLFGGLGLSDDEPAPRLAQVALADRHKELFGSSHESTLLGIPAAVASRMSHAAAGCGIIAVPNETSTNVIPSSPVPQSFRVLPGASWKLGLSAKGLPLALHPVPGATIAILGSDAQITNALQGCNWPEQLRSVIHADDESHDATQRWRESWNPGITRIVTRTCSQQQLDWVSEHISTSTHEEEQGSVARGVCDRLIPGILADVIVILQGSEHHGLLLHRAHRQAFTPFTYRPTSSSLRTARVASALAASSSSAG